MALFLSILLLTFFVSEGKCGCLPDLPNLRNFSTYGYGGYFNITLQAFQREIDNRVFFSEWESVNLYPRDRTAPEFSIYLSNVKDTTLKDSGYEPNDYNEISITLPVKVGATDPVNGSLQLGHFTTTEDTLNPYLVNYTSTVVIQQLNITEEANSVTWSIKNDSGELEIKVERTAGPRDSRYAFRKSNGDGKYTVKTDFPRTLNWSCEKMPKKPPFCSVLSKHSSDIAAAGEHISNINTARYDDNGDDDAIYVMEITKITGVFWLYLPFAQEKQKSVFAFRGSTHETVGIAYHCLNPLPPHPVFPTISI